MKYLINLLIFLFAFSFEFFTCVGCSSSTGPIYNTTGRRDYIWTVDTIKTIEPVTLSCIWGSSPENLWAVGPSASSKLTIWHYNGSWWGCDSIGRTLDPWAIIGFSSNEIWIGNTNSTIWKYDGLQWQVYGAYKIDGFQQIWINNFDGTSSNNIYGVGSANNNFGSDYQGIILKYDGNSWKFINIPSLKIGFGDGKIDLSSGTLILEGTVYDPNGWINKVYTWDGIQLKELYSSYPEANVSSIQHQVYVCIEEKIYRYEDGKLVKWKDLSGTTMGGKIWCSRNENDFFMESTTGIGHYNGTDFKTIYTYPSAWDIYGGYIFDRDIFFILKAISGTGYNFVLHGKLK